MQANSASECTQSGCVSEFSNSCPSGNEPGTSGASYQAVQSKISSSSTYQTSSGSIVLDTGSVSSGCQSSDLYQCAKSYSVAVSENGFTLTSTSGSSADCSIGTGEHSLCTGVCFLTKCNPSSANLLAVVHTCQKGSVTTDKSPFVVAEHSFIMATCMLFDFFFLLLLSKGLILQPCAHILWHVRTSCTLTWAAASTYLLCHALT